MLIYCPKCHQGYEVDEGLIPESGRRLRCGACGEIFRYDRHGETFAVPPKEIPSEKTAPALAEEEETTAEATQNDVDVAAEPQPAEDQPPETPEKDAAAEAADKAETEKTEPAVDAPVDINDIFKRLSEQTEGLFEREKQLSFRERLWLKFKTLTGWHIRLKLKYIVVFFAVIILVSLYNNRYDIARRFPWTASVYGLFGIEAQILGEGLEFQNIDWIYMSDEETPQLEIKGFINNTTQRPLEIPTVRVEMLDANASLLKSQNQQPEEKMLKPRSRLPLHIIVTQPSPTTKYVFLTFVEAK